MKKRLAAIFLSIALIFSAVSFGAGASNANVKKVLRVRIDSIPTKLTKMSTILPSGPYIEMPPVAFTYKVDGKTVTKHQYATGYTYSIELKNGMNPMLERGAYDNTTNKLVTWQDTFTDADNNPTVPNMGRMDPPHETMWRRSYYGMMGGAVLKTPDGKKDALVAFMHGENKNGTYGDSSNYKYTTNTVYPWGTYETPADGTTPVPPGYNFDEVYFGYISLAYSETDKNDGNDFMNNDLGPIIWPSNGLIDENNKQTSLGVRHPYAFVDGDYVYCYYVEDQPNTSGVEGREPGLKVARAPIDKYTPGNWKTYYNGSFSENSLPSGFEKTDRSFVYKKGGRSSSVVYAPSGLAVQRFCVAKIKNTEYYLGISWDRQQNIALHVSTDLVNWSDGTSLREYTDSQLYYPALFNKDLTSQSEIDANGFWVLGSNESGHSVSGIKNLRISIVEETVTESDDEVKDEPVKEYDGSGYSDKIAEQFFINTNEKIGVDGTKVNLNAVPKKQGERNYYFKYYPIKNNAPVYSKEGDLVYLTPAGRYKWGLPKQAAGDKNASITDWNNFTTSADYTAGLQFKAPQTGKYRFKFIFCGGDTAFDPKFTPSGGVDRASLGDGGIVRIADKDGQDLINPWDYNDWYNFPTGENKHLISSWEAVGKVFSFEKELKAGETVTVTDCAKDNPNYDDLYFFSLIERYATNKEASGGNIINTDENGNAIVDLPDVSDGNEENSSEGETSSGDDSNGGTDNSSGSGNDNQNDEKADAKFVSKADNTQTIIAVILLAADLLMAIVIGAALYIIIKKSRKI
ncbi:MAG: hypothetical protein ACI4F7_03505 [Acutalibacteraceae bacterium]